MRKHGEGGMMVVEATIVFPVMFLVIFLMLFAGNAYLQKCRVDSIITELTIDGAAYCSDPQLKTVEGGSLPTLDNLKIYPYRAWSGARAEEMDNILSDIRTKVNNRISGLSTGLFNHMKPQGPQIDPKYKNYLLTASFSIPWTYKIEMPIRLLFEEENISIEISTQVKMPVSSTTEFIRNVDMAEDYLQQCGIAQKLEEGQQKIIEAITKVREWLGK